MVNKRRNLILIVIVVAFLASLFAYRLLKDYSTNKARANFMPPPVAVSSAKVKSVPWNSYINAVGSLRAVNGVDISSQVAGIVTNIYFKSGQQVKTGDPLIQLDSSVLQAQLKSIQADYNIKRVTYKRNLKLYETKSISDQEVDVSRSSMNAAIADMQALQAQIEHTIIRAPFDGRIGLRNVDIGQYVSPGETLTNLQTVNPIQVDFDVPSADINKLAIGQPIEFQVDADPGTDFKGKVFAWNAQFSEATRSITVRGQVENPEGKLYPGMFGNVIVKLPAKQNMLVVPQTAISYSLYGNSIFVIEEPSKSDDKKSKPTAKRVYITTGERQGNTVSVLKGIKAGDDIVTSGQLKLEDGSTVVINNAVELQ